MVDKHCDTSEFHQDTWSRYLMLGFVSTHIPWNAISNLELRRSYKALHDDLVLPSATTLSNICHREYALMVDAIRKQLLSRNKVRLALDGWTSTNKLIITSVIAYHVDRNRALREVQLAFDDVDHLFFPRFVTGERMIPHGPTYGSKASGAFEGYAGLFWAHQRPFARCYDG